MLNVSMRQLAGTGMAGTLVILWMGLSNGLARPMPPASTSTPGSDSGTHQTLSEIYQEARQLARTPGQRDQAIARYRSMIEIHQANERLVDSALRDLAQCYEDAGLTEAQIRFFVTLAFDRQEGRRQVLGEIFQRFGRQRPELVEKIMAEARGETRQEARKRPPVPVQELVKGILQREDKALRETSLSKLREMLASVSSMEQKRSGLATLRATLAAKFERAPFLSLVLALLKSEDEQIRALALNCIPGLDATADNLAQIVPLVEDTSPEVRSQVGRALVTLGQGEHKEQVLPALTTLLQDTETKVVERTLQSMWGQYSSPEFDALLIRLSRNPCGDSILHPSSMRCSFGSPGIHSIMVLPSITASAPCDPRACLYVSV